MSDLRHLRLADGDRALLEALPAASHARNGVPSPEVAQRRRDAMAVIRVVLADLVEDASIRHSVLGVEWSTDVDVHVREEPPVGRLEAAGWLPLDGLLRRVGRDGAGRWAVRDSRGRALALVDFDLGELPDPLEGVFARARRRGEVRVREVLELRALQRAGRTLPAADPVVGAAARAEAALGGTDLPAAPGDASVVPPVPVEPAAGPGVRRRVRRPQVASRRFVVAFSGVDGSGKSTLARAVGDELGFLGIATQQVWARPGMRVVALDRVARLARRALRQSSEPAMQRVAKGMPAESASRRGALGWAWAMLIVGSFLADVWRRHLRTAGVVLYDRHALDAEVTLAFVYRGVDLRFHHWLVRRALPKADLTIYLHADAEVAAARKPGDTFGAHAIAAQLEEYARRLPGRPAVHRLEPGDVPTLAAAVVALAAGTAASAP